MINRAADIPGRVIFDQPTRLLEYGAVPILLDDHLTPVQGPHFFLSLGFGDTTRGLVGVWAPLFSLMWSRRVALDPAARTGYWSRNHDRASHVDLRQFWIVPTNVFRLRADHLPNGYDVTTFPVSVEHAAKDALARYRRGLAAAAVVLEGEAA